MKQEGRHNSTIELQLDRLKKLRNYEDLSTVCVIPTRGQIPDRVCMALWNLMSPMNQKFYKICIGRKEVGEAYNGVVEEILANPELKKWRYLLTVEEDNLPPADGLLRLYEAINKYDVVSGLYWTKGENGQPMIYGDPKELPKNFRPQLPRMGEIQECNGLGMGFTLFRMSIFKKLERPWFKTVQELEPGGSTRMMTQDLYFFEKAGREGYRFAVDTNVRVGHLDVDSGETW